MELRQLEGSGEQIVVDRAVIRIREIDSCKYVGYINQGNRHSCRYGRYKNHGNRYIVAETAVRRIKRNEYLQVWQLEGSGKKIITDMAER